MDTYCSQILAVDLNTTGTVCSHYDVNSGGLPAGAGYGIRECTTYNDHIALVKLYDINNSIYTNVYNSVWTGWCNISNNIAIKRVNATFTNGSRVAVVSIPGIVAGSPVIVQRISGTAVNAYPTNAGVATDNVVTIVLNTAVSADTTMPVSIMYHPNI